MPGVDTRHIAAVDELTDVVEEAMDGNEVDRLLALFYLERDRGRRNPSPTEVEAARAAVRREIYPQFVRVFRDFLEAKADAR